MQDYKKQFQRRFKDLEKDIRKSLKSLQKIDAPHSVVFSKKQLLFGGAVLGAVIIIFSTILILHAFKQKIYDVSFLGKVKIEEEFNSMSNMDATGGNEIKSFETNSAELKFFFYKIKQGESVYTLAKKLGVSMDTLISLNSMENAHSLEEGKRIIVPNLQGILYNVKKGDNLESIAKKYKINLEDVLDANDLQESEISKAEVNEGDIIFLPGAQLSDAERAKILGYLFVKPLRGRFTSGFGVRMDPFYGSAGYHPGVDISAPIGTTVKAAKEGRVVYAGWYGGYGKCIIIKHKFGYETIYGHLSSIGVKKDYWISVGQYIGRVGSTGRSTGAHLHFEVRKFGRPINPLRLAGLAKAQRRWY
jgi:murein DD-endopeptidase MepM/ murein hydrolase activator NlpD